MFIYIFRNVLFYVNNVFICLFFPLLEYTLCLRAWTDFGFVILKLWTF